MLFVTQLRILPGQFEEATRLFKHPKLPNNVMVHEFLGLLGKPDAIVIFEAPDASTAADFMVQFSRVTEATTSLALPIEEFKWRSEEHTSELQSRFDLVCRLLLEKKKQ